MEDDGHVPEQMTIAEYLNWYDAINYELVDGQPVPLPVMDTKHELICKNVCRVFDEGIAKNRPDAFMHLNYPIVVPGEETVLRAAIVVLLTHPTLAADIPYIIVDILPDDGSLAYHRRRQLAFRTVPDVQEIVQIDSAQRGIELWSSTKVSFNKVSWSARENWLDSKSGVYTMLGSLYPGDVYNKTKIQARRP
jgi:hypothetical protein